MSDHIIEIDDVCYSRRQTRIFDHATLGIQRGKVTAIMGPSGTGKTTLLSLMTGQICPDSGNVAIEGVSVTALSEKGLYALRRRMGMLFQSGALMTDLNVFENVAFPLREHTQLPESLIRTVVLLKLHSVGLRGAAKLMPAQLSGGMARRVGLARAIVMDPEIIFYDEPFVGLDPISVGVISRLIRTLNDTSNLTSVVVSHDQDIVFTMADHVCMIAGGKMIACGTPLEVSHDRSALVHQFVNGEADGPIPFHYPAPDYTDELLGKSNISMDAAARKRAESATGRRHDADRKPLQATSKTG